MNEIVELINELLKRAESIQSVHPMPLETLPDIRVLRKLHKLTQVDMGKRMGVTPARISQIENDKNINAKTLGRYLKAIGYTVCVMPTESVQPVD